LLLVQRSRESGLPRLLVQRSRESGLPRLLVQRSRESGLPRLLVQRSRESGLPRLLVQRSRESGRLQTEPRRFCSIRNRSYRLSSSPSFRPSGMLVASAPRRGQCQGETYVPLCGCVCTFVSTSSGAPYLYS